MSDENTVAVIDLMLDNLRRKPAEGLLLLLKAPI
jgi:hypothetical protein